ncbi:hypothetical protein NDU88_003698 [Pleurodeles waltl]|uniref:Uncharacterized protein n=1 Tax=Pleurodeles waltl TaxID=8319 RepID=A0AAV7M716_PLEWA|nr:hypothetical protein NDU88_003698 [Pleurodeles waltl]
MCAREACSPISFGCPWLSPAPGVAEMSRANREFIERKGPPEGVEPETVKSWLFVFHHRAACREPPERSVQLRSVSHSHPVDTEQLTLRRDRGSSRRQQACQEVGTESAMTPAVYREYRGGTGGARLGASG